MKKLVTALVIIGVCYGIYQFAIAANGWFQMSGAVDQVAEKELPAVIEQAQAQAGLPSGGFGSERYVTMREGIMKAAEEHNVPLRREAVAIGIVDNMLEVRLAWDAPLIVYDGRSYIEIPMSMQRRFSLQKRKGF